MNVKAPTTTSQAILDDQNLDQTLRPATFEEYVGQHQIKENLRILIGAAQKRKEPIEHLLLHGPSGLGKTTLAYLVAKELGDRKSTRLNSSHVKISYAVFCL